MDLYQLMGILKQMGAMDILLPFLLFYAIFLGILTTKAGDVLGKKQSLKQIMAFTLSMFIVAYTPFGNLMGDYLTMVFGGSSTIIVGVLALILIAGMMGLNMSDLTKGHEKLGMGIVIIVAGIIWFIAGPGISASGSFGGDTVWTFVLLAAIIGAVFWASNDKTEQEQVEAYIKKLHAVGKGTDEIEAAVKKKFPNYK
ncbi:MAG: hypothetical protein K0B02_05025 [DPANN group archaeon]|nr:hypothetical protein [DPANN group archaeon]